MKENCILVIDNENIQAERISELIKSEEHNREFGDWDAIPIFYSNDGTETEERFKKTLSTIIDEINKRSGKIRIACDLCLESNEGTAEKDINSIERLSGSKFAEYILKNFPEAAKRRLETVLFISRIINIESIEETPQKILDQLAKQKGFDDDLFIYYCQKPVNESGDFASDKLPFALHYELFHQKIERRRDLAFLKLIGNPKLLNRGDEHHGSI